jgi:hypothetical protein
LERSADQVANSNVRYLAGFAVLISSHAVIEAALREADVHERVIHHERVDCGRSLYWREAQLDSFLVGLPVAEKFKASRAE